MGAEASPDSRDRAATRASRNRAHRREMRDAHGRARLALSITPMIDVVFQLLIYFLLTAGIVGNERLLRAEAPAQAPERAAADADPFALELEPLVIRLVRERGATRIALSSGLATPADAAQLERTLRDAMLTPNSPRGLFAPDHPVRLAPARDVPWEDVAAAFRAVIAAGYSSVAFGGESAEGRP
jgi:biopolymer transport protein ExbD